MRALLFLSLIACQQSGSTPERGSGSAKPAGSTLELPLPPSSGKPPIQTKPMDKATLDRLAKLKFDGFTLEVTEYPKSVAIRQRATTRPRMSVNIAIAPCSETNPCVPMKLAAWRAQEVALKEVVDKDLIDRPDTTFEIGESALAGATTIYIYQAGQFFGRNEKGNVGSYAHSYTRHYNDGVNLLRVTATYSDDPRETLEDMKRALPRDFLERVTAAFLDAYGQAWAY